MKRSAFLVLAGVLACAFGAGMLLAPQQMLANMTNASAAETAFVLRWTGSGLIAIGVINILARNDPGSPALRAIILGNIALHVVAWLLDLKDFRSGFVQTSAIVMGSVVHLGLMLGFLVYLRASSPQARTAARATG
jgi:hypothetical protein